MCSKGWSGGWFSNNGLLHLSASCSHACSLRGHIQIAGIFLRRTSASSSGGAGKEEDAEGAGRLPGRWASRAGAGNLPPLPELSN